MSAELSKSMAWLHHNAFHPNRRTAALIYAWKYMEGPELTTFTKYATELSYAFNITDRRLLANVAAKQRGESAPPTTTGIGQIYVTRELVPTHTTYSRGIGQGPESIGYSSGGSGSEAEGGYDPDFAPDGSGGGGGGGFSPNLVVKTINTLLGIIPKPGQTSPAAPTAAIPVGTRHPQNPAYMWNGQQWVLATQQQQPTPPTTAAIPIGTINAQNPAYMWDGQKWVLRTTPTAPTAPIPGVQPPTVGALPAPPSSTILYIILGLLGAGLLLLR